MLLIRRKKAGVGDMPKQGFSIDDLLHPKSRRYNDEKSSAFPTYGSAKNSMGSNAAKKIRKELKLQSVPVCLDPIIDYLMLEVVLIANPNQIKALGRYLGNGKIEIVKGLPEILFRSTLAHEIGHAALNHDCRGRWIHCTASMIRILMKKRLGISPVKF